MSKTTLLKRRVTTFAQAFQFTFFIKHVYEECNNSSFETF